MRTGTDMPRKAGEAAVSNDRLRTPEPLWHTMPADQVAHLLKTIPERGLSASEAAQRREQFGSNALAARSTGQKCVTIPRKQRVCHRASGDPRVPTRRGRERICGRTRGEPGAGPPTGAG